MHADFIERNFSRTAPIFLKILQ